MCVCVCHLQNLVRIVMPRTSDEKRQLKSRLKEHRYNIRLDSDRQSVH